MATNVTSIFKQNIDRNKIDKITETLYKYTKNIVNKDKSVSYREIPTMYFLENDIWSIDFFSNISQFKEEIKLIVYNKIFSSEWSLKSTYTNIKSYLKKIFTFMDEKFPILILLKN